MPKISFLNKKTAVFLILAVFCISADRLIKFLFVNKIISGYQVNNILKFDLTPNPYIAFSIPLSGLWLNFLIFLIILLLIFFLVKNINNFFYFISMSLIVLGAGSNLLDRIKYSYVIDYIDLKYFTVFNIADTMISLGVALLLFYELKTKEKTLKNRK